MSTNSNSSHGLKPYMSPLGAWALSLGTAIGWGSLVVTANTYLRQAGPAGSTFGLILGAAVMIILSRNYAYMMNAFPDAGGAYSYTKEVFGYDYGFLTSWFLVLTYAAVLWANASSLPLFAKYFIGEIFMFGKMYTIFGYDVFLGELLLTIAAFAVTMAVCSRHRRLTASILIAFALILAAGITICFAVSISRHGSTNYSYHPGYVPDSNSLSQIIRIACISPWAFIGFENISHATEELTFSRSKVFRILVTAVISATALYIFILILSVSAYPPEYSSWIEYINDLGSLSGLKALPAFYAAEFYMGSTGVMILIISLLGLIITSLIGNTLALSRLIYSLAKDSILPERFARLNTRHVPSQAMLLIFLISLPILFLGRTAIGWIVDVTTIGATLVYALVSAAVVRLAGIRNDKTEKITGWAGLAVMAFFGAYLLLPSLFLTSSLEKESFFLFVIWGILGFIFFRNILRRDSGRRFGQSLVVWIALLSLVLIISLIWMSQSMMSTTNQAMNNIHQHYIDEGSSSEARLADEEFVEEQIQELRSANARTILVATGMFAFALVILLTNYSYMNRKARESEEALGHARAIAYNDPLTGVKNKRAFTEQEKDMDEKIHQWVSSTSSRSSDDAGDGLESDSKGNSLMPPAFSVVVCDVNGLKHINDTYGHKAGDEYIRSASRLICDTFEHSPVFRIGGDEFVAILSGRDYEHRDDLLREFNKTIESNIGTENVVIAAGISDFIPSQDKLTHSVFERADSLMYERKQQLKSMGSITR